MGQAGWPPGKSVAARRRWVGFGVGRSHAQQQAHSSMRVRLWCGGSARYAIPDIVQYALCFSPQLSGLAMLRPGGA